MSARQERGADRGHALGKRRKRLELARRKNQRVAVVQRSPGGRIVAAVHDEALLLLVAVLDRGDHLRAGWPGKLRDLRPLAAGEREGKDAVAGDHINIVAVACRSAHDDLDRQCRQRLHDGTCQEVGVGKDVGAVVPARAEDAARSLARNALADDVRQWVALRPRSVRRTEERVGEAALLAHAVLSCHEVGSARDDEASVGQESRERPRDARRHLLGRLPLDTDWGRMRKQGRAGRGRNRGH